MLLSRGFQILGQGIELRFPERAVLLDPGGGALHRRSGQTTAMDAAIDFTAQQAGGFEDAKMFGDGGEGHAERLGEFGDFGFPLSETGEDGATGGIGERTEGGVKKQRIFNHMV